MGNPPERDERPAAASQLVGAGEACEPSSQSEGSEACTVGAGAAGRRCRRAERLGLRWLPSHEGEVRSQLGQAPVWHTLVGCTPGGCGHIRVQASCLGQGRLARASRASTWSHMWLHEHKPQAPAEQHDATCQRVVAQPTDERWRRSSARLRAQARALSGQCSCERRLILGLAKMSRSCALQTVVLRTVCAALD